MPTTVGVREVGKLRSTTCDGHPPRGRSGRGERVARPTQRGAEGSVHVRTYQGVAPYRRRDGDARDRAMARRLDRDGCDRPAAATGHAGHSRDPARRETRPSATPATTLPGARAKTSRRTSPARATAPSSTSPGVDSGYTVTAVDRQELRMATTSTSESRRTMGCTCPGSTCAGPLKDTGKDPGDQPLVRLRHVQPERRRRARR